jgi:hypothetical protein
MSLFWYERVMVFSYTILATFLFIFGIVQFPTLFASYGKEFIGNAILGYATFLIILGMLLIIALSWND